MKRGLGISCIAIAIGGVLGLIELRSVWWRAVTRGPSIPGLGHASFPGGTYTQSAAGQFSFVSLSAFALIVIGIASWMVRPRVRIVIGPLALAASIHVIVVCAIALRIDETVGPVPNVPLNTTPVIVAILSSLCALIGSILLTVKYRRVERPMLPTGAPKSFEEPDAGVWE